MVVIGLTEPVDPTGAVYVVEEDLGPILVCVEVIMGGLAPGQTAAVDFSTNDATAQGELFKIYSQMI